MNLLAVEHLKISFPSREGEVKAVNDVSFIIEKGQILGIVGESGSGKSVTALSILGLLSPSAKILSGTVKYLGTDVLSLSEEKKRKLRGSEIAIIFQDPMTSLNPVLTIGEQIAEAIRLHKKASRRAAWEMAIEALNSVSIPDPRQRAKDYPHQLSGGMRQRVMIAIALSCDPKLLIADEPTTALDVTIQAQILELLHKLREERELSILLITHDLGVIAEIADSVSVMYAGEIVENALVEDLFKNPQHPYTQGLLASVPRLGQSKNRKLSTIEGNVPSLINLPSGCAFVSRCKEAQLECKNGKIELVPIGNNLFHSARCRLRG